jgi:ferredoxin-NADP reductase
MLGKNFINVLTREKSDKYYSQHIDKDLINKLVKDFNQYFYVCGPDKFVEDIKSILKNLGVTDDKIVIEK